MNNPVEGVIAALLGVLALVVAFGVGVVVHINKISSHCQNYGKFTAEGKLYECKEVGVAK
jgi:archaellum biogenesis protein FlaJ (TadC family)